MKKQSDVKHNRQRFGSQSRKDKSKEVLRNIQISQDIFSTQ